MQRLDHPDPAAANAEALHDLENGATGLSLVFAGSIGRTDLPGGSMREMLASLATRFLPLPDETVVLPGHGPETTVGRERAYNPFLADLIAGSQGAGR
jgi:hypothetical protein